MSLDNTQIAEIKQAILAAFTRDELADVLMLGMNLELYKVVKPKVFEHEVTDLIRWIDRQGREFELITCIYKERLHKPEVEALYRTAQEWGQPNRQPTVLRAKAHWTPPPADIILEDYHDAERVCVVKPRLGPHNPFKYPVAEHESMAIGGDGGLFWKGHQCVKRLQESRRPVIVLGEPGSGKSAFATYGRAAIAQTASKREAVLAVLVHQMEDFPTVAALAALDVLTFAAHDITCLDEMTPLRKRRFFQFLNETLGIHRVMAAIPQEKDKVAAQEILALAREQADTARHFSPEEWLPQLGEIAKSLGMDGAHLLIDNFNMVPASSFIETLSRLPASRTQVTCFTEEEGCAAQLVKHGFEPSPLHWNNEQLLDMASHRIDFMNQMARRSGYMVHRGKTDFTVAELKREFFEDDARALLLGLEHLRTPRRIFFLFSHLMHQRLGKGKKRFGVDNVAEAYYAMQDRYGP